MSKKNTGYILELVDEINSLKDRVNKLEERTVRLHNEIIGVIKELEECE